jgi:Putative peptidoglycan binding domain
MVIMPLSYPLFKGNTRIVRAGANSPPMKFGEKGPAVAILQSALITVGYKMPKSLTAGIPDGVFGSETKETIYRFQKDHKLKIDGIVGAHTFAKLDQLVMAASPTPPLSPPPVIVPSGGHDYQIGSADPPITADVGAGVWNTKPKTVEAMLQKELILQCLPGAYAVIGDDAVKHMAHYLANSGKTLEIDLEGMVEEVPSAKERFLDEINEAKQFIETLPVGTYTITSAMPEGGYNVKSENRNWYYAVGGYSTWGKGKAIVKSGAGPKEYELEFEYRLYDRYNWDRGKQVKLFDKITVTDEFMGEFHRQGLAREFDMTGSMKRVFKWKHGGDIPSQQFAPGGGR